MLTLQPIHIYYFSGTGNTKSLIAPFSEVLKGAGFEIKIFNLEETNILQNGRYTLGLIFPVAVQSTFPLVWDFIYSLPSSEGRDVFMFDSMEYFSGGIIGPVKKILLKKGYCCIGAREFRMSSSLNTKSSRVEKGKEKNGKAEQLVRNFAYDLIQGKTSWNRIPFFSDLMRAFSTDRKIWTSLSRNLSVTDSCILCRICVKNCPIKALSVQAGKIEIDHDKCNSCMRCAALCPKQAYRLKKKEIYFS